MQSKQESQETKPLTEKVKGDPRVKHYLDKIERLKNKEITVVWGNKEVVSYLIRTHEILGVPLEVNEEILTPAGNKIDTGDYSLPVRRELAKAKVIYSKILNTLQSLGAPKSLSASHRYTKKSIQVVIDGIDSLIKGAEQKNKSLIQKGAKLMSKSYDYSQKAGREATEARNRLGLTANISTYTKPRQAPRKQANEQSQTGNEESSEKKQQYQSESTTHSKPPNPETSEPEEKVDRKSRPRTPEIPGLDRVTLDSHTSGTFEYKGIEAEITYWNKYGDIISSKELAQVPVNLDVKLYTKEHFEKGRLVYSGHFSSGQLIRKDEYPYLFFRIPKEQIDVQRGVDPQYGILEVTLHTSSQGSFFGKDEYAWLWE